MKRPLNLNASSASFVKVIGLFVLFLPAALYLCGRLLGLLRIEVGTILLLIILSLGVGGAITLVWIVLIIVEQVQDHLYDRHYRRQRSRALHLPNGNNECQFCGNRQVHEEDRTCSVCGRPLIH